VTYIHFVSEAQRSQFIQHYPQLCIEEKSFHIPNYTIQSKKCLFTGNVGVIGYLSRPDKNAIEAIELGQQSNAKSIQCWGSKEIHGLGSEHEFSKLSINGWTHSIQKMHDSFDVLISASKFETFGLIVAEALSAGIPCVISDIPPFRSLYADCEGVAILTGNRGKDIEKINEFIQNAPRLKQPIIDSWNRKFNSENIKQMWLKKLEGILAKKI
jgi:glycosyltransferase involved in cell wall biosynthesis